MGTVVIVSIVCFTAVVISGMFCGAWERTTQMKEKKFEGVIFDESSIK